MKRDPSAVFISVTGLLTRSVTFAAPLVYEPPAIEILAVVGVSETRWNSGVAFGSVVDGCGKSVPTETDISVPLTEMTAAPGAGCSPAVDPEPEPAVEPEPEPETPVVPLDAEPDPDPDPDDSAVVPSPACTCCANGSLLANRLNDASWPCIAAPPVLVISPGEDAPDPVEPVEVESFERRRPRRRRDRLRHGGLCAAAAMHLLHHARNLEGEQAEEQHPADGDDDLLLLLFRLEGVLPPLLRAHQGAPGAAALALELSVEVVSVEVVSVDVVSVDVVSVEAVSVDESAGVAAGLSPELEPVRLAVRSESGPTSASAPAVITPTTKRASNAGSPW